MEGLVKEMISMSKSFEENIAAGNQQYEKFVYQVINHGKIDDGLAMLMDTNDVVNVVALAVIRCLDATGGRFNDKRIPKIPLNNLTGSKAMIPYVENIGKLYATLPQDTKESLYKGLGLSCIMELNLVDGHDRSLDDIEKLLILL